MGLTLISRTGAMILVIVTLQFSATASLKLLVPLPSGRVHMLRVILIVEVIDQTYILAPWGEPEEKQT